MCYTALSSCSQPLKSSIPPPSKLAKTAEQRRLSSTPKNSIAPLLDLSLEDAVFDNDDSTPRDVKKTKHPSTNQERPRLSQVVVDSGRRRSGSGKNKKRGLSVSFVQGDEPEHAGRDRVGVEKTSLSFAVEKDLATSLVDSLNSSRYGALDRSMSRLRKTAKFPRKYAGDDPRLGYDWIAGLLDTDSYLAEHDDEYFEEMREFRKVNRSECCRPKEAM